MPCAGHVESLSGAQRQCSTAIMCGMHDSNLLMQAATAQLAEATEQPISLQIMVLDDPSNCIAATLTPAKPRSPPQDSVAAELKSAICHAAQGVMITEVNSLPMMELSDSTNSLPVLCTPGAKIGGDHGVCATPEARAAAAHLLRGLGLTDVLSLEFGCELEPEWPVGPPPSLAASPQVAVAPVASCFALPAELVRDLDMGSDSTWAECTTQSGLDFEMSSNSLEREGCSPERPRVPYPTPSATPITQGGCYQSTSALALDAKDIAIAFSLAHEQLRSAQKQTQSHPHSQTVLNSPESCALPQSPQEAGVADEISPVVKTTRQVSSVLAAVAQLEAAQGVTGKRRVSRPFAAGSSRFIPPNSLEQTPANRVSTRFFQSPAMPAVASTEPGGQDTMDVSLSHVANPLFSQSDVTNPLFSPLTSSADPMLTPFYTPASMSSIRTGYETPAGSSATAGRKENLAGGFGGNTASLMTPASGVVTGDWRSVTDRLQALRAQLQSAQKKLKATSAVSLQLQHHAAYQYTCWLQQHKICLHADFDLAFATD